MTELSHRRIVRNRQGKHGFTPSRGDSGEQESPDVSTLQGYELGTGAGFSGWAQRPLKRSAS